MEHLMKMTFDLIRQVAGEGRVAVDPGAVDRWKRCLIPADGLVDTTDTEETGRMLTLCNERVEATLTRGYRQNLANKTFKESILFRTSDFKDLGWRIQGMSHPVEIPIK